MSDNPNMVAYLDKLNANDKAIICAAVREHSREFKHAHQGMLPFLPIRVVVGCLDLKACQGANPRVYSALLSKLEVHRWGPQGIFNGTKPVRMLRKLDDGLVVKRLGLHPERGVPIPGLAAVIKRPRDRKMFEKAADAYDDQHPMLSLKRLDEGLWQITCPERYRHYVETWCMDYLTK